VNNRSYVFAGKIGPTFETASTGVWANWRPKAQEIIRNARVR
jgi:hypothetical protein